MREAVGDRDSRPHEANLFDLAAKYAEVVSESDIAGLIESARRMAAHKSIARQARDIEAMNAVEFPRGEIDPRENRTAGDGKFAGAFICVRKPSRNWGALLPITPLPECRRRTSVRSPC